MRNVVDAGLQKIARYDAGRGIDSLITERITQDAADQRAGRAGRTASGLAVRLWDSRDRLRPHREADIHRIDLANAALDVLAWGGQPGDLEWFEAPRPDALDAALELLARLEATDEGRITPVGRQMQRLPLHPRLARMLIEAKGAWPMAQACALLSERLYLPPRAHSTTADLLSAIDAWDSTPTHVKHVAVEIARLTAGLVGARPGKSALSESAFRRALLVGYPDRVGRRRSTGSPRVKLCSGTGAVLGRDSGVVDGEFIVALDVRSASPSRRPGGSLDRADVAGESVVQIAARIEPEWLRPTERAVRCWFDADSGLVRAARVECYGAITLHEASIQADDETAAALLADAWLKRGPAGEDARLLRRMRFAGYDADVPGLLKAASAGHRALSKVSLARTLDAGRLRALERDAPETLTVPSGRSVILEYTEEGTVNASVKLQELFGLKETPRVGARREPVLLSLLAPNGRPVQVTRDLRSFWERTYPEVRRELRGRYPKHPWPEDPWHAAPTARTKKRST